MTQPAPGNRLTPAQIAALLTLVKAQAAVRQQLSQTAVAAAMTAFKGIGSWWAADDVAAAIDSALKIIRPTQKQAAQTTSAYMAQVGRVISGRSQKVAPIADLSKLRKDMTSGEADEWLDGIRVPAWVVLGNSRTGPADTIDDPATLAAAQAQKWLDAADPYGRVADAYRFNVTMRGDSPDVAEAKALVRIAAVAESDVTLAVRQQYHDSMSSAGAIGFRRILHPELSQSGPCALCVVASDRLYKTEDLLPLHGNCCCEVLPVYEHADPGIHLNGDDLRHLYEAAGGNTRAALREVTVALAEHAELGPILVDANQNNRGPVDYARQKTSRDPVKYGAQLQALEKLHEITQYRVSRGDQLERTLRDQKNRIQQLQRLAGVS